MTLRGIFGNALIASGGYAATKAAALSATGKATALSATDTAAALSTTDTATALGSTDVVPATGVFLLQLSDPYLLVGFTVPNWLGLVFFALALACGTIAGMNQETPVDDKFKRKFLKPFYSLVFGILMTLFVVPSFYPDVTIWSLIVPAGFFAAIGSVVIYYVIAFFTSERLWVLINTEAHSSAPELISMVFDWGKGVLKAVVGRADK